MQNEKSQLQNREAGMRVLRARLLALALEEQAAKDSAVRGAQIRTVDRSEKVRTYNFPDNRVADHRSGYKANNLSQVLDGDLDAVIQSLVDAGNAAALSGEDNSS
jgi:peptide chain release factor 1